MELKALCEQGNDHLSKLRRKPKILYLIECREDFGPTSSYSAERFVY